MADPYCSSAKFYDRRLDGINKGLKLIGIRLFRPSQGMRILDVGCGTGSHLELYQRYQCHLYGLDMSPSMLEIAHQRLNGNAQLILGNAVYMPYESGKFDLIIAMLSLHEMSPEIRPQVLAEIRRVRKDSGHILLIDFHTGPYQPLQGWISKAIIFAAEVAAGRAHFRNYRNFMANGGLAGLVNHHHFQVEKGQFLGGGTFAVYLVS